LHKDSIDSLFPGANQIKLTSCHSTNETASALLAEGHLPQGSVIITDHQTKGKGQRGNSWESEPGKNLTCSIILKPRFLPVQKQFELTVVTSLAVVSTLEELGLPLGQVKWPNDIYYGDAKIAGILIENTVRANQLEHAVVGIGLNVNQVNFEVRRATSIRLQLQFEQSVTHVFDLLYRHLAEHYDLLRSKETKKLRKQYISKLRDYGVVRSFRNLKNDQTLEAKITGVNDLGQLLLSTASEDLSFNFKEVSFLE
jgi:BirA family biotin operon repressor/biotin-[acetyl-CoA-carboxylase] ligase